MTGRSPLDHATKNNLSFLMEIRNEIEHQMTTRIDEAMSAKFQACAVNFNHYLRTSSAQRSAWIVSLP